MNERQIEWSFSEVRCHSFQLEVAIYRLLVAHMMFGLEVHVWLEHLVCNWPIKGKSKKSIHLFRFIKLVMRRNLNPFISKIPFLKAGYSSPIFKSVWTALILLFEFQKKTSISKPHWRFFISSLITNSILPSSSAIVPPMIWFHLLIFYADPLNPPISLAPLFAFGVPRQSVRPHLLSLW